MKNLVNQFVKHKLLHFLENCTTNNEGPQKNKQCKLPFQYKRPDGKVINYKRCTTEYLNKDEIGKAWCPTADWVSKSNRDSLRLGGEVGNLTREKYPNDWGYCSSKCAIDQSSKFIFIHFTRNINISQYLDFL